MKKLYVMQGLPASGKSTKSEEIIKTKKENTIIRINRDLLRDMLHFGDYSKLNEREVMNSEKILAQYFLNYDFDVIIDDTNLHQKNIDMWKDVAEDSNAEIEVIKIDTSMEECIKRDKKRGKSVGEDVIRKMVEWNKTVDSH